MEGKRELQKNYKGAQRSAQEAEKKYFVALMSDKTSCIPELIWQEKELCEKISPLSASEAKIVFKELFKSQKFLELVANITQNSSELQKAREVKAAKAERRRQKAVSLAETDASQNAPSEEQPKQAAEFIQSDTQSKNQF